MKRFWDKVDKRGPDECWPWMASLDGRGYGQFQLGGNKLARAHRLALKLSGVEVPDNLCVCHRCDNPVCCNPSHLFLGTHRDNALDKIAKGRARTAPVTGDAHYARREPHRLARGERHGCAKLDEAQVLAVRASYTGARGEQTALAKCFGLSKINVCNIVHRKIWRHV